ncbi:MAG: uroporphyrinogen-III synthase [Bacteroidales bacterium]|jgi:uroporphyrinogen-III synthase|nr:uroporphyrinogen-III synthase [Bacteroidales bacterium]
MKVKNVLISQNAPADFEKSPYSELTKKFSINIDFCKFFQLEGVTGMDFRKNKINLAEHTAVVFSSKNTIDYFFQLTKELRIEMPESTKYICPTDQVAHYLQKYVQYRKRKILFGKNNNPNGIFDLFLKNKTQKFLIPCGEDSINTQYVEYLEKHNINFTPAVVFHTVMTDLKKEIDIQKYDMIVFFSPHGIVSLKENYPDFEQKEIVFAALGLNTAAAIQAEGWDLQIMAPTKLTPSITTAISLFLKDHATRKR